jgi:ABC-type multidrug transport system ATPase subunit
MASAKRCEIDDPAILSVEARQILKRFGSQTIIRDLSLSFHSGDVVLLLGANGAGKSTLLRVLAGLTRPDRGQVSVTSGARVGFAGHHTALYSKLSLEQNLAIYAKLVAFRDRSSAKDLLQGALREWGLEDLRDRAVSEVSRGAQSKASLARALMGNPQVLLLDEPSSNLDERATETLRTVVAEKSRKSGITIIATHDLARLRDIASRVVVMDRGSVVADSGKDGSISDLNETIDKYRSGNR